MDVELSRHEEFALVRIDRPQVLNALSFAVIEQLSEAFGQVARQGTAVRALIVTGAGEKAFCAGADIAELQGRTMLEQQRGAERGQEVFSMLDALPIPSVALMNGYAFGGGLELALACTFRLATANAKMGLPEVKLGLIPGYGGTQRLPRLVGEGRALELILGARTIGAEEARQIGLIHRVVEGDPLAATLAFAREFTGFSLETLRLARASIQSALSVPLATGLKIEAGNSTLAYQTRDAEEGMAAFLAKRAPRFSDR